MVSVLVERPWALSAEEVLEQLEADSEKGLGPEEVTRRRRVHGWNALKPRPPRTHLAMLLAQFTSPLVWLLLVAGLAALLLGETTDSAAIFSVLILNGVIGYVTELRATRSMEALLKLGVQQSSVVRGGEAARIEARELVPGDILTLEAGDGITADARVLEASRLLVNESILTGEALPVEKHEKSLASDTALHERRNMLYRGCTVTRGTARAVVVNTGIATEIGAISEMVTETDEETPLEKRLERLGITLVWATVLTAGLVAASGIFTHKEPFLILETAVALAVSAIPEGLPIVATIALARGMWLMSRRKALVRRLAAVETLGSTSIILTDKTGTLTENRLSATEVIPAQETEVESLYRIAALCSNASEDVGDPLEVALVEAAAREGFEREALLDEFPEIEEFAFETETRRMATLHVHPQGVLVVAKGAPEQILELCPQAEESRWHEMARKLASEGLKVLALADKVSDNPKPSPFENLTFRGLIGLSDPPRAGIDTALKECREAGIRVIMATGDQAETARSVAHRVGLTEQERVVTGSEISGLESTRLLETDVFARVTPAQKKQLIELHKKAGAVVAMTGDGVNDAPALKAANIGIAMGEKGSQVAEEAADLILEDDRFSTIVSAVEEGRVIFDNIRSFALYLLSCNLSELAAVGLAALATLPIPLLPLQILFLNMVTDIFPALALGVSGPTHGVMKRKPRNPKEPILNHSHWRFIVIHALVIAFSVLGVLVYGLRVLELSEQEAVTLSFLTLGLAQTFHVFNVRAPGSSLFSNSIVENRFVWLAILVCFGSLWLTVYLKPLAGLLSLHPPSTLGWTAILIGSIVPLVAGSPISGLRSEDAA